jgi:hypothetical protein
MKPSLALEMALREEFNQMKEEFTIATTNINKKIAQSLKNLA